MESGGGRIGLAPLGEAGREETTPHSGKRAHSGGSAGKGKELRGTSGWEGNAAASVRVGQDGVEPGHAVRAAALRTPVCVSWWEGGLGAAEWDSGSGSREGTAVGDGLGCWWGQGLGPQWDQGTTVEWHMKGGATTAEPFPAHQPSFLRR